LNTGRASNTGPGSDIIVLIEAGGFYSRKYGIFYSLGITFSLQISTTSEFDATKQLVLVIYSDMIIWAFCLTVDTSISLSARLGYPVSSWVTWPKEKI